MSSSRHLLGNVKYIYIDKPFSPAISCSSFISFRSAHSDHLRDPYSFRLASDIGTSIFIDVGSYFTLIFRVYLLCGCQDLSILADRLRFLLEATKVNMTYRRDAFD